jgi:DNA-binding transcriptional regulator YiaG
MSAWPNKVLRLRSILGLTQDQLAQQLGVTTTTISRWERGDADPSDPAKQRIQRLLRSNEEAYG